MLECVWKECFYKERTQFLNIAELGSLRKTIFKDVISRGCAFPPVTLQLLTMFLELLLQRQFVRPTPV